MCGCVFSAFHPNSCRRTAVHENFRAKIRAVCVMYSESEEALTVLVSESSLFIVCFTWYLYSDSIH